MDYQQHHLDITSLDLIFHSSKKSSIGSANHFHHQNSFQKKINGINNIENLLLNSVKDHEKKKHFSHENKFLKNRIALGEISNFYNSNDENQNPNEKKMSKSNKPYFRRIYSNEFMEFENESTKDIHYVKKYKEDDITFTKSKILPGIQWQDLDNDVDTDEVPKKKSD